MWSKVKFGFYILCLFFSRRIPKSPPPQNCVCIFKSSPPISFFLQALGATVLFLLFVFIDTYFEEIIPLELQQLTGHPPSFFQNITQEKDFQQVVVTDTKMLSRSDFCLFYKTKLQLPILCLICLGTAFKEKDFFSLFSTANGIWPIRKFPKISPS